MIREVKTKKDLKAFVYFIKDLYKTEEHYVFPIFYVLKKELKQEILVQENYKAILSLKNGVVNGRLMFTYSESKKKGKEICYFSFFDTINDKLVVKELFDYMEEDMKKNKIDYCEGTYTPYDQETRRGVLVSGFDIDPTLFTSYNYEYYGTLLEEYGFYKAIDTVSLNADVNAKSKKRLNTFSKYFNRSHDVRVDSLNYKQIEKDLEDVHLIFEEATNEVIYQDAPSIDILREAALNMKMFINPNLIKIARENKTNKPVGFCVVFPDFNQVFKKTKGKLKPIALLRGKKKITKARGTLQYITSDYQNTGLIGHIFKCIFDELEAIGITDFEAGTMMEDNDKPITAFKKFGGEIIKVYRIFGKDIKL